MGIKYTYYNKKYYLFKQIKNKNEKKISPFDPSI